MLLVAGLLLFASDPAPACPQGELLPESALSAQARKRVLGVLMPMNEPTICGGNRDAIRVVIEPSFDAPVVFRVHPAADGETAMLTVKNGTRVENEPGVVGKPGPAKWVRSRELTKKEWKRLKALFQSANLAPIPAEETERRYDGWSWVVEVRRGDSYLLLRRFPPDGALRELAEYVTVLDDVEIGR